MATSSEANKESELDEWAQEAHEAIRDMVESLNGDLAAFDRDPMTFQHVLDEFVRTLPLGEMEKEDWVWLHTQLAAYLAEVLIRTRDGRWEALPDDRVSSGTRYVVTVTGRDGHVRQVDPFELVHENLLPVPQRIPRILERALAG
ncbi:hypothetical protein [Actinomadura sp. HBU206391]|uniref:hypothetical protein n=1 Tax=Actinomadura sp. HBU206391 TaxID=2731692 RepID=UPI00164FC303|nr:hypothetical protein [Actinomadura sp. HBU206391]MBC6460576.1 hypothetical protein [Actinomadura sp. HBU206391]